MRAAERAEDAHALVTVSERYQAAVNLLEAQDGDSAERGWVRVLAAALHGQEDLDQALKWTREAVKLADTSGDASLGARAQALHRLLLGYRGESGTTYAISADAFDAIEQLPSGTGTRYRREQLIDSVTNRGAMISSIAYGGRFAEMIAKGTDYLAQFVEPLTTTAALGALAEVHNGLSLAYAHLGQPALAQRSYAAATAAFRASGNRLRELGSLRSELICAVLPYRADDLAGRERVDRHRTVRSTGAKTPIIGITSRNLQQRSRMETLILERDLKQKLLGKSGQKTRRTPVLQIPSFLRQPGQVLERCFQSFTALAGSPIPDRLILTGVWTNEWGTET